jgi:hypothetical protein
MSDTTSSSELANLMNGAWQIVKIVDAGKDVTNDETEIFVEVEVPDLELWNSCLSENASGKENSNTEDGESSHFLWFNEEIIVTGDSWAAWEMPYRLQCDRFPMEIDITREDLPESWLQKCIFELADNTLQICGAGSAVVPRPSGFSSSIANQQILYIAKRCNEPQPN